MFVGVERACRLTHRVRTQTLDARRDVVLQNVGEHPTGRKTTPESEEAVQRLLGQCLLTFLELYDEDCSVFD